MSSSYRDGVAARNRIWLLVGGGFILGVLGGALIGIGISEDSAGMFFLGYLAAALASASMFVGLIAAGVSLGMNASKL